MGRGLHRYLQLEPVMDRCQSAQLTHLWGEWGVTGPSPGRRSQPARLDRHVGYMSLSVESGWAQGCGLKMITELHKSECYHCSQTSLESLWIWVVHTNKLPSPPAEAAWRMLAPAELPEGFSPHRRYRAQRLRCWLKQAVPLKRGKSEWLQVDLIFFGFQDKLYGPHYAESIRLWQGA